MNLFPKIIPITVLTGFLGSGKTTLLSEFVRSENVNDVAFIINEFGEVGLDHHLIDSTDETILELQNGCICCTIQEDLKSTLLSLLTKMEKGLIRKFNRVIIETTGLADPVPIIHTLMTSNLAKNKAVRTFIVQIQQDMIMTLGKKFNGIILEGRDCGSVVAPKADLKLYLTASLKVRAERRFKQFVKDKKDISYEQVLSDLRERDVQDKNRKHSPLQKPKGAVVIDNSDYNFKETINIVKNIIFSRIPTLKSKI